ncbi:helix-turn-helix domain-containing protein [Aeromonas simiae]|uniref:helix-turn-helix domain-containing protein n=1 Tax=Aeromonas simiae TaxID=218936 RepID=UPI0005AA062D|nr:helix-turn-helix transcriptional regulator [Aeromonas simiae]MDO2950184.1 helix-turn-helix transcriptional regulator [Aeromonas simiae]MDO2953478.1 helix-turn-helix transcriptional regulator [Aeromonas simiae]MDO2957592.1 helix-turn-helix transcriptional regulator [Aeromonas simiae]
MPYSQVLANNILETLKKILNDKGIRYQSLADALGVSIATVKRMMNKPSLPFDSLLEICHLVGLSFEELLERTQDAQSRRAVFTKEQDDAFHNEPGLYAFLANIFWREKSLVDLRREYGLTDASCYLYLRKLEKLGILQLGIDNSYHFLISERITFEQHSRFARQQARQAMTMLGDYLVDNMHKTNNYMALCQLHLEEHEAMALIERMKEYWHSELKLNRPAVGQREGSKTYTMSLQLADCGYQSFDDLIPNIDS